MFGLEPEGLEWVSDWFQTILGLVELMIREATLAIAKGKSWGRARARAGYSSRTREVGCERKALGGLPFENAMLWEIWGPNTSRMRRLGRGCLRERDLDLANTKAYGSVLFVNTSGASRTRRISDAQLFKSWKSGFIHSTPFLKALLGLERILRRFSSQLHWLVNFN